MPFQLGKKGLQAGCKASEKACEACGQLNVNARKFCGGCGVNLHELKVQKKKEEIKEIQKGINDDSNTISVLSFL